MTCPKCKVESTGQNNFCTKCGTALHKKDKTKEKQKKNKLEEKILFRIGKVAYILYYIFLVLVAIGVWLESQPYYSSYYEKTMGSVDEAFGYTLLTLLIGIVFIRLMKVAFIYICFAQKADWSSEIKKWF